MASLENVETPKKTRVLQAQLRENFVKLVQVDKETLFGKLTNNVTDAMKLAKWEEIRLKMVAAGDKLLEKKDASYVRSTYWQNVRKKAVEKWDESKKTGREGGEQLNEVRSIFI
jgi:uncharacterized radical SAM superfamily Fe-S cluster-containing enzyme